MKQILLVVLIFAFIGFAMVIPEGMPKIKANIDLQIVDPNADQTSAGTSEEDAEDASASS